MVAVLTLQQNLVLTAAVRLVVVPPLLQQPEVLVVTQEADACYLRKILSPPMGLYSVK
jgi:hypothetical protein